jgi:hypothetical protein
MSDDDNDPKNVGPDGETLIEMPDLAELGIDIDADGTPDADLKVEVVPGPSAGAGAGSRMGGLVAMVLGAVGSLLMIVLAAIVIRTGFTAGDIVDRAMEPVELAFDRMETRIDEADDLVTPDGIRTDRVDELQARVDGLVDLSTGAQQVFESIEDHPMYRLLPAELSTLSTALVDFETSAATIDARLGDSADGDTLTPAVVTAVSDELDGLQGRVREVRDLLTSTSDSLRGWIRLGTLLGFFGSLWGLWAQICLARRGWRGFRGRPI